MTCDIEKTIKNFNERKKNHTYNQVWFFSAEALEMKWAVYHTFKCPSLSFLWYKFFLKGVV